MCWLPLDDITTCRAYARLLSQTPSCLLALVEFSFRALGTVGGGVQGGLSVGITFNIQVDKMRLLMHFKHLRQSRLPSRYDAISFRK